MATLKIITFAAALILLAADPAHAEPHAGFILDVAADGLGSEAWGNRGVGPDDDVTVQLAKLRPDQIEIPGSSVNVEVLYIPEDTEWPLGLGQGFGFPVGLRAGDILFIDFNPDLEATGAGPGLAPPGGQTFPAGDTEEDAGSILSQALPEGAHWAWSGSYPDIELAALGGPIQWKSPGAAAGAPPKEIRPAGVADSVEFAPELATLGAVGLVSVAVIRRKRKRP